jgi:hypothetical protein
MLTYYAEQYPYLVPGCHFGERWRVRGQHPRHVPCQGRQATHRRRGPGQDRRAVGQELGQRQVAAGHTVHVEGVRRDRLTGHRIVLYCFWEEKRISR